MSKAEQGDAQKKIEGSGTVKDPYKLGPAEISIAELIEDVAKKEVERASGFRSIFIEIKQGVCFSVSRSFEKNLPMFQAEIYRVPDSIEEAKSFVFWSSFATSAFTLEAAKRRVNDALSK